MTYETVADFYSGKSLLITGGTGFCGLVLIEKLLYSCPGIDKIYIILRPKKKVSLEERSQKLFENPVFLRLKDNPLLLPKIKIVHGDLSQPNLAIDENDEKILIENVAIVIHLAACVRFDQTLEQAVNTNVGGTERILDLCNRMKNLIKFVYVSTAYSNPDRKLIEEIIYPPPSFLHNIKGYIKIGITEKEAKKFTSHTANMYTFSKAFAETCVAENSKNIPSIIIRPSIVTASNSEPCPGWVDNWNGASALLAPLGKGLLRVVSGNSYNVLDLIPVDYVSNLIIIATAKCDCSDGVKVFNSCSSEANPITLNRLCELFVAESVKHKFCELPRPGCIFTTSKLKGNVLRFLLHNMPMHIGDLSLKISGKEVKYVRMLRRIQIVGKALEYFTKGNWVIRMRKSQALALTLSDSDRRQFPFDPADLDWEDYISIYFHGIKKYLLKLS